MTTWFTSDNHFGHANIIKYCGRPFSSVGEMDEEMVRRWNERVQPDDLVWHLGDFAFRRDIAALSSRLNGSKRLVRGNHDKHSTSFYLRAGFEHVGKAADFFTAGREKHILLVHRPYVIGAGNQRLPLDLTGYDLAFCGHVHEKWRERVRDDGKRVVNVGVDVRDFRPATLEELLGSG